MNPIWRWPLALAALTLFGLFSALLGQQGLWLWLAWLALGLPVAALLACLAAAVARASRGP